MKTPAKIVKAIRGEISDLQMAIRWSKEHRMLSTALSRSEQTKVCIERLHLESALKGKITGFKQRPEITNKIIRILYLIERTGWVPKQ